METVESERAGEPARSTRTLRDRLRHQSMLSIVAFAASLVSLTVTTPILISHLGARGYGAWVLTGGVVSYVSILDFGLSLTISRFVAQSRRRDPARAEGAITVAVMFVASIGATVSVVAFLAAGPWQRHLGVPGSADALRFGGVAVAMVLVGKVLQSALLGAGRVALSRWIQAGGTIVFGVGAAILVSVAQHKLAALAVFLLIQNGLSLLAATLAVRRTWDGRIPLRRPSRALAGEVARYAFGVQASSLLAVAIDPVSRFVLASLSGPAAVAPLDIALRARAQWIGLASALTAPIAPLVGRETNSPQAGARRAGEVWRALVPVVLAVAVLTCATALVTFPALFGESLGRSAADLTAVTILLWTTTVISLAPWSYLLIYGSARDVVVIQTVSSGIGMGLTVALSIPFGAWGPVVGLGIGALTSAVITHFRAHRVENGGKSFSLRRLSYRMMGRPIVASALGVAPVVIVRAPWKIALPAAVAGWTAVMWPQVRELFARTEGRLE